MPCLVAGVASANGAVERSVAALIKSMSPLRIDILNRSVSSQKNEWVQSPLHLLPHRQPRVLSRLGGCPTLSINPFGAFGLGDHPFGQDDIGRDYFALVMRGAQRSILVMFIIGIVGGIVGTVVGALSGFYRGWIDSVLMRFTDFIITIPSVIIGSVIGYHFGNLGVTFLALYLGLFAWTGLSRLVRGEFLSLREREFVDAAKVAGASNRRIIFKHILPNAVGVIIVAVTLIMSGAILLETALSYLGFGVVAPDVSLGLLISQYQDSFSSRPWLFWYPGIFIILIALTVNFIGDGLRDAFDPRQRRRISRKERSANRKVVSA